MSKAAEILPSASAAACRMSALRARQVGGDLRSRSQNARENGDAGFWDLILGATPTKIAHAGYLALLNWRSLRPLYEAKPGGALSRFVAARPEVWGMVLVPYVSAGWQTRERFRRIVDHCETIERLGPLLDLPADAYANLLTLDEIGAQYRLVLDQPRWLLRDGQMALSLWEGRDRLFSLSFCLSSESGDLTAYVGGVQGRREDGVIDRYRRFTKAAEGVRPSDMIAELFRMFCASLGVRRILAVSDAIRHQRSAYCRSNPLVAAVSLGYDDLWVGRGATLRNDGFFDLPLRSSRRPEGEIRPNKRAMYRRRYAVFSSVATRLHDVVRGGLTAHMLGWHSH